MTITRTTLDRLSREHIRGARLTHWATTEHVVYRYDPKGTPCTITYRSLPHACTGGANTLDDARRSYRSEMASLLGVGRHELPPVAEHLEAVVAGMWVRAKVGALHRDPRSDRMFLQTVLSEGHDQEELRAHYENAVRTGARAVLVIVEPDDTIGSVLDQMTADDALLVVHSDARTVLGWVTLYGPDAGGADDAFELADRTGLRQRPISELTRAYAATGFRDVLLSHRQLRVAG